MAFKREKFRTLVHYICWRCQDPTKLGSTKLNKVLWFADTISYVSHGEAITGARYVKRQFGPVPTAVLPAIEELQNTGALSVRKTDFYGRQKWEFFALTKPQIETFSAEEISLVDAIVDVICNEHTAGSISEFTHDDIWKIAEIGEDIPYCAILASKSGELTEDDMAWALREAASL